MQRKHNLRANAKSTNLDLRDWMSKCCCCGHGWMVIPVREGPVDDDAGKYKAHNDNEYPEAPFAPVDATRVRSGEVVKSMDTCCLYPTSSI